MNAFNLYLILISYLRQLRQVEYCGCMLKLLLRFLDLIQMRCRLQYKAGTSEALEPAGLEVANAGLWHLPENMNVVHVSNFPTSWAL